LFFGTSTTLLLNHMTKGYFAKAFLKLDAVPEANGRETMQGPKPQGALLLHTYTLLTRTRVEEVRLDDIKPPKSIMPFVTFYSERHRKNYCLEHTAFQDKDLWQRLFPFAVRE